MYTIWKYKLEFEEVTRLQIPKDAEILTVQQDEKTFKNFIEGTKVPHEGIVIKYHTGERNKIAKVINPDYLIASEKNNLEEGAVHIH